MTQAQITLRFVNVAHALCHLFLLIFATAVLTIGPELGVEYGALLPCTLGGFIAYGVLALPSGWAGDRWSRRGMMALFLIGGGISVAATGLARDPWELSLGLTAIGAFAAIYHPVGAAMLVACADRIGRTIGVNGVWGNMGVASAALVSGVLAQSFGWRMAFFVPGAVSVIVGIAFLVLVPQDIRRAPGPLRARPSRGDMARVFGILTVGAVVLGLTFNALTLLVPKLIEERVTLFGSAPGTIGLISFAIFACGALAQFTVGRLIDQVPLRRLFLPVAFVLAPALYLAAGTSGGALMASATLAVAAMYSQVTINETITGRYTSDAWRGRAYALRYTVTFLIGAAAVGLVAWLHRLGGFALTLQVLAGMCVPLALAALAYPRTEAPAQPK